MLRLRLKAQKHEHDWRLTKELPAVMRYDDGRTANWSTREYECRGCGLSHHVTAPK